jgi:hypothetical protein
MAVGDEAEVADAMEAIGQGVDEEAADELVGGQTHDGRHLSAIGTMRGRRRSVATASPIGSTLIRVPF